MPAIIKVITDWMFGRWPYSPDTACIWTVPSFICSIIYWAYQGQKTVFWKGDKKMPAIIKVITDWMFGRWPYSPDTAWIWIVPSFICFIIY